jgi:D-xylose transport system substrate-binding protein
MIKRNSMVRLRMLATGALLCGLVTATSAGLVASQASATPKVSVDKNLKGTVYLLYPNSTTPSWPLYQVPTMQAAFKKYLPNIKTVAENGNNSQTTQQGQVEAAIAQHAKAVVLSPPDPELAGAELKELAAAHIPAIAWDNDPDGGPAFAYVWVNFAYVGKWFGNWIKQHLISDVGHTPVRLAEIYGDPTFAVYDNWLSGITPALAPLVKSGKVDVVCKANTPGWVPATAQTSMQACLTQTGDKVDAVLGMNDSTMDGIAAALQATSPSLLGKVLMIGGHDGDLLSVQRVLAGDQIATFHPSGADQGLATVSLVTAALTGKTAKSTGWINYQFDNHYQKGGVPTVEVSEQIITQNTVQANIVNEHILTKAEICTGLATSSAFCSS